MYNSDIPNRAELPTARRLLRSTLLALVAAIAILMTIVLPAEYGIDPTGLGRFLGLAEMGEIKAQLAKEAEADRQQHVERMDGGQPQSMLIDQVIGFFFASAYAHPDHDEDAEAGSVASAGADVPESEIVVTLAPGEYVEIKLMMTAEAVASYAWTVEGGLINYDLHGHGSNGESESYEKGRGVRESSGKLTAAFTGEHGWFFRNRDKLDLTLTLAVQGEYSELKESGSAD